MTYYAGDKVIGDAHKPGYRARPWVDQNAVEEYPVAAGQTIKLGDIITLSAAEYAQNFESGSTAATYAVADLSRGMFQALNEVDNSSGSNGDQLVSVYMPGAFVELVAAAGIGAGNWVEMDVTDDDGTARTDQLASTVAHASRQRVRLADNADLESVIGSATTAGTATLVNPQALGVVGWVNRIITRDSAGAKKANTSAGDYVQVRLGRNR